MGKAATRRGQRGLQVELLVDREKGHDRRNRAPESARRAIRPASQHHDREREAQKIGEDRQPAGYLGIPDRGAPIAGDAVA
ncbi:hypothetical protein D3C76_1528150 [compost metagenome]